MKKLRTLVLTSSLFLCLLVNGCGIMPSINKAPDAVDRSESKITVTEDKVVVDGNVGSFEQQTTTETRTDGTVVKVVVIRFGEPIPTVTKGKWSFGVMFRFGYWWIVVVAVFGLLMYFCGPLVIKIITMIATGLGKAFNAETFTQVVQSVQKGREAIKKQYGEDGLQTLDNELQKVQDSQVQKAVQTVKTNLKSSGQI